MVRAIVLVGFAVPAIIASLLAVSLVSQPDIPFSAANPRDSISIEYTKHQVIVVSHGVTERAGAQKTEILEIQSDGNARYYLVEDGASAPSVRGSLDEAQLQRLKAVIKETGFTAVPPESFPVMDGVDRYQKSSVKVTLNGVTTEVRWPEQNATSKFIPPIITMIEAELDSVINEIRK